MTDNTKHPRGRPKLNRPLRDKRIEIFLTVEDWEKIKLKSESLGYARPGHYVYGLILQDLREEK